VEITLKVVARWSVLFVVTHSPAFAVDGFPQFAWPAPVPSIEGATLPDSSCPSLAGTYQFVAQVYEAACAGAACSAMSPRNPRPLYPVDAHPRASFNSDDRSFRWTADAPASLRGRTRVFELNQPRSDEMVVTIVGPDPARTQFTVYSQQKGDFNCRNGVLFLRSFVVFLGNERSSYRAGTKDIALVALKDGSVAYLVHEQITRRIFFWLIPTNTEDTVELHVFPPAM
jgi:hypothetical protein